MTAPPAKHLLCRGAGVRGIANAHLLCLDLVGRQGARVGLRRPNENLPTVDGQRAALGELDIPPTMADRGECSAFAAGQMHRTAHDWEKRGARGKDVRVDRSDLEPSAGVFHVVELCVHQISKGLGFDGR